VRIPFAFQAVGAADFRRCSSLSLFVLSIPNIHFWYTQYSRLDGLSVRRIHKKIEEGAQRRSVKPTAVLLAGLELFAKYGYRKTSIDDIASAAQVAKRTVYLHFENKAAVFLAILDYLGEQVRQRCASAERQGGAAVDQLTALLDAYFGMAFEVFSKSEYMPELEETVSKLAKSKVNEMSAEYEKLLAKFFRSLEKTGEIAGPPPGLTAEQMVRVVIRAAEGAKRDPMIQGDRKALQRSFRELATLTIAAVKK